MVNRFNIGGNGIVHAPSLLVPRDALRRAFGQADQWGARYGETIRLALPVLFGALGPFLL